MWGQSARVPTVATLARTDRAAQKGHRIVRSLVKRLVALVSRPQDLPAPPSFVDIDPIRLKLFKIDEYFQKHQLDLALKECREIIELDPASVIAYVRLGSIYYSLGIKKEAVRAWEYAAKLDPTNADVKKSISFMRAEGLGETPAAPAAPSAPTAVPTTSSAPVHSGESK